MKYIGIIGTRRRDTASVRRLIETELFKIYEDGDILCSGGCPKGGDRFAEEISKAKGIPILIYYPNYKKYGSPGALFSRNTQIAETSTYIIACVVNPEESIELILNRKKGGTEDTLRKFSKFKEHNINRIIII